MQRVKVYRMHRSVQLPKYATEHSACFDICAWFPGPASTQNNCVQIFRNNNQNKILDIGIPCLVLPPNSRALVPTGLIFDLSENQSLRLHPRSGLAIKHGITLANCEGVVDADYVNQLYVGVYNMTNFSFEIKSGDRIAQGEIVYAEQVELCEVDSAPKQKTDRAGGFGSTGK